MHIPRFFLNVAMVTVIVYIVNHFLSHIGLLSLSIAISYYMFTKLISKESFINSFFLFGIAYFLVVLIQYVVSIVFGFAVDNVNEFIKNLINMIATLLFSILLYQFVPLSLLYRFTTKHDFAMKALLVNCIVVLFSITAYSKLSLNGFFKNFFAVEMMFIAFLFINGEAFIMRYRLQKQKQQLEAYNNYMPIIDQLITQVRINQHEHDNNIQTISALPYTYNSYDDLSTALDNFSCHLLEKNAMVPFLKINLKLLAALLYNKQAYAESQSKTLHITIESYHLITKVPEYELVDILGILINNALEAINPGEGAYIGINSNHNRICLTTKNKGPAVTPELTEKFFTKGYTTKNFDAESHGLGLFQLKKLVDHYGGEVTLSNEFLGDSCLICIKVEV